MNLIQFIDKLGNRKAGIVEGDRINVLKTVTTTYSLFQFARENNKNLVTASLDLASNSYVSYSELIEDNRILVPLDHPDPYHMWVTGTGLTHLGSAESRDQMHKELNKSQELTDSMKLFKKGLKNGKLKPGKPASQPEWFYKGNGLIVENPYSPITCPSFSLDGGEEPELVGLYVIDKDKKPFRIGFALGNEFSDHKMERINYLYLAHSKLRSCSYGPELLIGDLPDHIAGKSRIYRNEHILWEKEFFTGENNMTHNISNLEYHHFKYDLFCQPGDVHAHFLGTSVLSFSDGIESQNGDIFEIEADIFVKPLRNPLISSNR